MLNYDCGFQLSSDNIKSYFYLVNTKIIVDGKYSNLLAIPIEFLTQKYLNDNDKRVSIAKLKIFLAEPIKLFTPIYEQFKYIELASIGDKKLKIELEVIDDDSKIDLPLEFQNFSNNIFNSKPNTNKISIYQLLFSRETKKNTIPNPEYTQKIELIKQLSTSESKIQMSINDLPPSTITQNEEVIEINSSKINECSKSFDTLYLRQKDKQLLMKMLDNFCNSHHIYEEFEIPHKLGLLLYGEPGTGKSTAIKTIASYAKRNIYYVDLQNVKTNSELKQLFDYVIKECSGGNILVFEDIDCMTNIVKPRQVYEEEYDNLSTVLRTQNDELTLSYFLNLLDGTLCAENTMFIMTTNYITNLDDALIRQGRIDVKMELKKCDHYQIECMHNKIIGSPIDKSILQRISEGVHRPVDIIHHLIHNKVMNNDETNILRPFFMPE
jgi:hypothetical protein